MFQKMRSRLAIVLASPKIVQRPQLFVWLIAKKCKSASFNRKKLKISDTKSIDLTKGQIYTNKNLPPEIQKSGVYGRKLKPKTRYSSAILLMVQH